MAQVKQNATGERPRAYEEVYPWCIARVPRTIEINGKEAKHPGRTHGIFVVHGIGMQSATETAVQLRSGFEDALDRIAQWQCENPDPGHADVKDHSKLAPPFVSEGYWANYASLEETFVKDWKGFNEREHTFFGRLWTLRTHSFLKTAGWFLKQQVSLLSPGVRKEVGWAAWLLYMPLQVISLTTLIAAWVWQRKLVTGFLEDLRLYFEPKGMVEQAMVQRIDYRVGEAFLRMIGLDWNFRKLPENELIEACGERLRFDRVVWVAHSLGTVVSYNVLSDLFHRAGDLKNGQDKEQREGAQKFLDSLSRFVTLGSPLDKAAFLFKNSLRPWPGPSRRALLEAGESFGEDLSPDKREWWINFYHVLDPVSGALSSELLCGGEPPANFHIKSGCIPGAAHMTYWKDDETLRFILGRTFGKKYLRDKEYKPISLFTLKMVSVVGYFTWATLLCAGVVSIYIWGPGIAKAAFEQIMRLIGA